MAKTRDEIVKAISEVKQYTEKTPMAPTEHLWNDQRDSICAILGDILDLFTQASQGVNNIPVGFVLETTDPDWNPNMDTTESGERTYAGTWQLLPPGLVPYTATTEDGDYSLTVAQIKQILSSYRNIPGSALPSDRFPLGGTTGEPANADGSRKSMDWSVDFAIPIADWYNSINVVMPYGNMGRSVTSSPRLDSSAWNGWGNAGDRIVHDGSHRHTLKEGYVQFNQKQVAFDIRQKGYLCFKWRRIS